MLLCERHYILKARTLFGPTTPPNPNPEAPHAWKACRNAPLLCDISKVKPLLTIDEKHFFFFFFGFSTETTPLISAVSYLCHLLHFNLSINLNQLPPTQGSSVVMQPVSMKLKINQENFTTYETCDAVSTCLEADLLLY